MKKNKSSDPKIKESDGRLASSIGDYQRASYLYEEAADSWEKLGDLRGSLFCRALALENRAKYFKKIGKFKEFGKKMLEASKYWDMLGEKKNAAWCLANFHVNQAIEYSSEELRDEAITEYEFANKLFHQINDKKSTIWCKAQILICKGIMKGNDGMYYDKSRLFLEASSLLNNIMMFKDALNIKADGWSAFGLHKKKIYEYEDAKRYFQIASKIFKRASNELSFFWCLGHTKECEYLMLKENFVFDRDIDRLISTLRDGIDYYKKSKDLGQSLFLEGDFHKYIGLKMKRENKFHDAIEEFSKAEECYSKLPKMFPERKYFYEKSVLYAKALKIGTIADLRFIEQNFKEASGLYQEAYNLFRQCEDFESAKIYENFRTLCQTINNITEGRIEEAVKLRKSLPSNISSKIPKKVSLVQMAALTNDLMKLMLKQTEEIIDKISELDKGPAFEARIRDLIRAFDDREFTDKDGRTFGVRGLSMLLHKYEKVEREEIHPEDDEAGIVFDGRQPVEIDVLAERVRQNRSHILICECKNRPNKAASLGEIDLLCKKANLVRVRYKKIAKLQNRYQPLIEDIWFISIGGFSEKAKEIAKKRKVKVIDKEGLNVLLRVFHQFTVR